MEVGYMGTSLEADLINGFKYVNRVSRLLENNLPSVVTQEELMNYYLHEINPSGSVDFHVTVVNLVQAANLANIRVKGKSKLEVVVPVMDQWRYIREGTEATTNRRSIREKLLLNKDDIVETYKKGATIKELSGAWHIAPETMRRYLKEFGVELRKKGVGELATKYGCNKKYKQKKRRKSRAE